MICSVILESTALVRLVISRGENFTRLRLVKLQTLRVQLLPKLHCKPCYYIY